MTDDAPLSPHEEDICACVRMNRVNLQTFLGNFAYAAQLFQLLERGGGPPQVGVFGGVFIQFRIIAAKEGALNIYHLGCSLDALRGQVGRCPETRGLDAIKLREADKLFKRHFPNADTIRHAIAHAGEVWTSPARAKQHQLHEDHSWVGGFVSAGDYQVSGLFERTYSLQWGGRMFEVQMDASTVQKLSDVLALVHSAFP